MSEVPPDPRSIAALPDSPAAEAPPEAAADVGSLLALKRARIERAGRKAGHPLFRIGCVALAAAIGYLLYAAKGTDPSQLAVGSIILVLAAVPALLWTKRARYGLPLFEAFMLPGINTYAVPLLAGHQALQLYDNATILTAAIAVIVFQLVAIAIFYGVRTKPKRGRVWRTEIISGGISKVLGYGMLVTTAYTFIVQFTDWIPSNLVAEARAACYGIGIIATFVQCRRWGQGDLPYHDRGLFLAQLIIQVVFSWVALFLVQGVSILLLGLIGYVSGSKKLPVIALVVGLVIIGVLFNGKATMRAKYWDAHAPAPTLLEVPGFFSEWFADGLSVGKQEEGAAKSAGVLDRTSLIQMMCLVVSNTPERKPYMMGNTYADIPGQLVPRLFWPGKPLGLISTYKLSIYYDLQTQEETIGTTIGFGMLPEAYANFGFVGMGLLGLFLGLLFNKSSNWCAESPIFSYPGLFTVVLMAWTFQTEAPLSAWLASMFQSCEMVLGIPYLLKYFL
jgi:hypothetical protein